MGTDAVTARVCNYYISIQKFWWDLFKQKIFECWKNHWLKSILERNFMVYVSSEFSSVYYKKKIRTWSVLFCNWHRSLFQIPMKDVREQRHCIYLDQESLIIKLSRIFFWFLTLPVVSIRTKRKNKLNFYFHTSLWCLKVLWMPLRHQKEVRK